MATTMKTPEEFIEALKGTEIRWMVTRGHPTLRSPNYPGPIPFSLPGLTLNLDQSSSDETGIVDHPFLR